ncbi:hypothetical protein GIB67_010153 [Kingdonia uniflora]|uniref:RCC1-like domain-containing protein n=1 Tax=Kingdonia uniflora TaxID=39325 RepID=A0A7J7NAR6_9MAGN|nr:hypothetical protein GIB67_010153 [Kingdonia uniflora]
MVAESSKLPAPHFSTSSKRRKHSQMEASSQELVLRDNKMMKLPDISIFKSIVVFDVSFNEISSLHGLSKVSNTLKELYISKNEVTKMEELDHLHNLQILELGSNRLRVMENLHNLTNMQELWLGRNRIRTVNLCGLKNIRKLSLQSNRLTSMAGFQDCVALEELYLSHNGISKMEGLSTLLNLRILDISSNKLEVVRGIENLMRLEDLWLNDNQIASLECFDHSLAGYYKTDTNNLSQKVVSVSAGEAHTLALTGDGSIYSWGRGTFGRLGTGKEDDELFPVRVEFDSFAEMSKGEVTKIVGIATGAYHSLALQGNSWVKLMFSDYYGLIQIDTMYYCGGLTYASFCLCYSVDCCTDGQLGLNEENSLVPRLLEHFLELGSPDSLPVKQSTDNDKPLKVHSVIAGGMMSLAIDTLGALWIWGNCPQQSSSNNNNDNDNDSEFFLVSNPIPLPVWNFHGHTVVKVACGNEHVVALVSAGETVTGDDLLCYSWGNNNHGQLGLGDKQSRCHPEILKTFNLESLWKVHEVACGAFHTALLVQEKISEQNENGERNLCWTFGLGDNGQLGHGTTNSKFLPEPVEELPQDVFLVSVDCGLFHTCVVSSTGDVWSWGMEKGLGLCPDASFTGTDAGDAVSPLRIQRDKLYGSTFMNPVQVVCGAAHTILVAYDGDKLWAWGRGWSGVLGRGNIVDSFDPCIMKWPPLDEVLQGLENVENEMEKKLSSATEEVELLRSKLGIMERYAGILHGSIFAKPFNEQDLPSSLQSSGSFDIVNEWENILELADHGKLTRMEVFYRNMLASVKDKLMKRRIQELIKECLQSSTTGELPM